MEQIKTNVKLGIDEAGKPSHFEALGKPSEQKVLKPKTTVTHFSKPELDENAKLTAHVWEGLGVKKLKDNSTKR